MDSLFLFFWLRHMQQFFDFLFGIKLAKIDADSNVLK